ncbi:MAG: Holliday junction resolvase RuvX [Chloroflexi bacterium]|nr:Holliday junction resolvase RuvX [Chloroflexota bacterium]
MGATLGLDVGERRIGVAVGDPSGSLASPLTTVMRTSDRAAVEAIGQLAATHGADMIVVGLPLQEDGSPSPQAARTQAFARKLRAIPGRQVVFWDERYTTVDATERLTATRSNVARASSGRRREAARRRLDAAAAAVMLQDYLNHH